MATLYTDTLIGIAYGLKDLASNSSETLVLPEPETIADRSYVKWEANGGVDLQLPSFKLTNRQMFWLCRVHTTSRKYHKDLQERQTRVPGISNVELLPSFREAFHCNKDAQN